MERKKKIKWKQTFSFHADLDALLVPAVAAGTAEVLVDYASFIETAGEFLITEHGPAEETLQNMKLRGEETPRGTGKWDQKRLCGPRGI